jgi:hypothetical protein
MPQRDDKWWWLRPADDAEMVAKEVDRAVREYLLPAIDQAVKATRAVE